MENVLLHAASAVLFWRLLVQLRLPGAWLAGAIFALHPIMVESVAWITERKNVLSLAFYLGALLAYGKYARWDSTATEKMARSPDTSHAARATGHFFMAWLSFLFLCALLAKTTAFSLPAVILLIGWWKRGQIRWRADVMPMLPFFAVGICLSMVTAWLEKHHAGAQGADFAMTFPERCLVAGHSFWFYLGNLFWPAKLCFVYPQWRPDPGSWWQWLFPAAALAVLLVPWLARGRIGRGPATAMFFFAGTLFPALGFINVYGMIYSLVWDHWVYMSSLGIIALVAALVARLAESLRTPAVAYGFAAIVLPLLSPSDLAAGGDVHRRGNPLAKNAGCEPGCWLADNDLGLMLMRQGHVDEAIEHYQDAIQYDTNSFQTFNNLGMASPRRARLMMQSKTIATPSN